MKREMKNHKQECTFFAREIAMVGDSAKTAKTRKHNK
jgi:hypothetical protein